MTDDYPLVSAIMLVGRTHIADIVAAINCFKAQTYPYRELIIVNNAKTQLAATALNIKAERDVFLLDTPGQLPTGAARNYGIAAANGQILAQFDADYYHHPQRLEAQIATLAKNAAHVAMLSETLSYSFASGRASYQRNDRHIILNTMVCIRPAKVDYPNVEKSEEFGFLNRLLNAGLQPLTIAKPELCCKLHLTAAPRIYEPINVNLLADHFELIRSIVKDHYAH